MTTPYEDLRNQLQSLVRNDPRFRDEAENELPTPPGNSSLAADPYVADVLVPDNGQEWAVIVGVGFPYEYFRLPFTLIDGHVALSNEDAVEVSRETFYNSAYPKLLRSILNTRTDAASGPKPATEANVGALPGVWGEVADLMANSKPIPEDVAERFQVAVAEDFGEGCLMNTGTSEGARRGWETRKNGGQMAAVKEETVPATPYNGLKSPMTIKRVEFGKGGISGRAVLHPEHQEAVNKLKPGESTTFTDEQNDNWIATRSPDGNTVHFEETGLSGLAGDTHMPTPMNSEQSKAFDEIKKRHKDSFVGSTVLHPVGGGHKVTLRDGKGGEHVYHIHQDGTYSAGK